MSNETPLNRNRGCGDLLLIAILVIAVGGFLLIACG
jgi:hypothetical protein